MSSGSIIGYPHPPPHHKFLQKSKHNVSTDDECCWWFDARDGRKRHPDGRRKAAEKVELVLSVFSSLWNWISKSVHKRSQREAEEDKGREWVRSGSDPLNHGKVDRIVSSFSRWLLSNPNYGNTYRVCLHILTRRQSFPFSPSIFWIGRTEGDIRKRICASSCNGKSG